MYRATIALAAMLLPFAALAVEPPPLTAATAAWTDEGKVELSVTYEGSACEEVGEVRVEAGQEQTNIVTLPTVETAEVCTMQIVPVEYTGTIAVEPTAETLSITVLDFDGQPKASSSVEIETSSAALVGDSQ